MTLCLCFCVGLRHSRTSARRGVSAIKSPGQSSQILCPIYLSWLRIPGVCSPGHLRASLSECRGVSLLSVMKKAWVEFYNNKRPLHDAGGQTSYATVSKGCESADSSRRLPYRVSIFLCPTRRNKYAKFFNQHSKVWEMHVANESVNHDEHVL